MYKLKTNKQIKDEIKRIQKERKTIREFSMFGTNNWENMDEEIDLYTRYLDGELDIDDLETMDKDAEEECENYAVEIESEPNYEHYYESPIHQILDFIQGYR